MLTGRQVLTRSTFIAAPPTAIYDYLADASNVPAWAPAFARRIRPQGTIWLVTTDEGEFNVAVLAEPFSKTVDIVVADDHTRGLFTRVRSNDEGSELLFTLLLQPEATQQAIDAQITTLDSELAAVRNACQHP